MSELVEQKQLVGRIRKRFPAEAALTDQWLVDRGYDQTDFEEMTYAWVEAFADRTTDAVREKDAAKVKDQTDYMAKEYQAGSEVVRNIIDVAYAESIMWNVENADKAWAWPNIADKVRRLYEAIWGVPRF